jgi:hypothetical protein
VIICNILQGSHILGGEASFLHTGDFTVTNIYIYIAIESYRNHLVARFNSQVIIEAGPVFLTVQYMVRLLSCMHVWHCIQCNTYAQRVLKNCRLDIFLEILQNIFYYSDGILKSGILYNFSVNCRLNTKVYASLHSYEYHKNSNQCIMSVGMSASVSVSVSMSLSASKSMPMSIFMFMCIYRCMYMLVYMFMLMSILMVMYMYVQVQLHVHVR